MEHVKTYSAEKMNELMMEAIERQDDFSDNHHDSPRRSNHGNRCSNIRNKTTNNGRGVYSTSSDDSGHEHGDDVDDDEQHDRVCAGPSKCLVRTILFGVVAGILLGVLFRTGVLTNNDLAGVPIVENVDFEGFFDSDPYGGVVTPETPEAAYKWYTTSRAAGLELTIANALTDDWQREFQQAVADWDAGSPDTLTLSTQRVPTDVDCEPLNGLLKVCNGNYGETDWYGLNTVLLDMERRYIFSSTAKMNDFFLQQALSDQRQYTMCHELGHGFGLPHWDEDFYNRNQGNCMDYTSRPRTNKQPSASNFEFLKQLYGEVGGETTTASAPAANDGWTTGPFSSSPRHSENEEEEDKEDEENEGDRKLLRRGHQYDVRESPTLLLGEIPESVLSIYRAVTSSNGELPSPSSNSAARFSRRVVHSHTDGEAVLIDMGIDHFGLLVWKLRPFPM